MATKLPSFLQRSGPPPMAQLAKPAIAPADPVSIFRARAPVLLNDAAQKSAAPTATKTIFHRAPPVLVASPAAPDRAPAAKADSANAADDETEDSHRAGTLGRANTPALRSLDAKPSPPAKRAERLAAALTAPVAVAMPSPGAVQAARRAPQTSAEPRLTASDPGNGFRVVALPRLAQGGRWRTEAMRSYSAPVLIWFTRGQGRITVAGATRGFGAHNAVFLPPGTMHGFEMTAQVFGSQVTFPRDAALMLPDRPHHLRFRDAVEQNELSQMIDNLTREIDRDLPVAERALAHHAGLLSVWLERQILKLDPNEAKETAARRLVAAYTALVEQDVSAARSVADFAARLGVTPTHLTRSCNAACGRSAHDILSDRVFFEARRLLRDSSWPVKKIAISLGFTSPAYFTRAFQKATRETPTAFRKRR